MRGLSAAERQSKYNYICLDVRERVYKAYPKNIFPPSELEKTDINTFYFELFNYLGEFELEYIITNLFFEDNFNNIVYYIKRNSNLFDQFIKPPIERYTFKWLLYLYLNESDFLQSTFIKFFKNLISSSTNMVMSDLKVKNRSNKQPKHNKNKRSIKELNIIMENKSVTFEMLHKYPKWVMNKLIYEENLDEIIFIHFLIIKCWGIELKLMPIENKSSSSIILLNYMSKYYDNKIEENKSPKLYSFVSKANQVLDSLFIKDFISNTPLLDSEEKEYYKRGFYIKKRNFLDKISEAEYLNKDLTNESYSQLFYLYFNLGGLVRKKVAKDIKKKLKLFEFPTYQDLENLNKIKVTNELAHFKKWFLSKIYLFEIQ